MLFGSTTLTHHASSKAEKSYVYLRIISLKFRENERLKTTEMFMFY